MLSLGTVSYTHLGKPEQTSEGGNGYHDKPKLTIAQQIAHLEAKGVTFDRYSKERAAAYLSDECDFYELTSCLLYTSQFELLAATWLEGYTPEGDVPVRFDGIDMIVVNAGRALLRHHINKLGSFAESIA